MREIRELLKYNDLGACPCGHTHHVVAGRIIELNNELARLKKLRRELVSLLDANDTCPSDIDGRWPCEDHLINLGGGDSR